MEVISRNNTERHIFSIGNQRNELVRERLPDTTLLTERLKGIYHSLCLACPGAQVSDTVFLPKEIKNISWKIPNKSKTKAK